MPFLLDTPKLYSPVNSEIWTRVNDPLSSQPDFKYIFEVIKIDPITSATTSLGSYKVPPRPSSGDGLFTCHKILRTQVSYNLQPYTQVVANAPESIVQYRLRYGYEYSMETPYTSTINLSGKLGLVLSPTSSNPFIVDDIVYVDKTNKTSNPQYDGNVKVLTSFYGPVLGVTISYIQVDKDYVTSSATDEGFITSVSRIIGTTSDFYAFNGTRQYSEINTDFSDLYVFRNDIDYSSFLTNYGELYPLQTLPTKDEMERKGKVIYNYQFETLPFMLGGSFSQIQFSIGAFNSSGTPIIASYSSYASANEAYKRYELPIGTANLALSGMFGTTSNIAYYVVIAYYSGSPKASKIYKVKNNCSPYPNNYRLAFLNRFGGFDYYNFNYKSTNTINTERVEYKKILDWNYNIGARQDSVLSQKATNTWTISTDWITEKESNYFKELLTSPEVYLITEPWEFYDNAFYSGTRLGFVGRKKHNFKVGDPITIKQFPGFTHASYNDDFTIVAIPDEYSIITDGAFVSTTGAEGGLAYYTDNRTFPVVITDTSYTVKTSIDDKLFSFSITFKYAYDVNLQNQ
jgi:hypothetical protein